MDSKDYDLFFPYENYRKNQENTIFKINKAVIDQKNILLVAPNGTGKTIINLAAVLPVAIANDLKIIYLCRTHTQNARVIYEISKINNKLREELEKGIDTEFSEGNDGSVISISAVSLKGRSEMCLNRTIQKMKGSPSDMMRVCADFRKNRNCKYFNSMIKSKTDLNNHLERHASSAFDSEDILSFCKEIQYCPYFFSKLLMKYVRIIVCNYQWIFNPSIKETFLEGADIDLSRSIIIMDECHNLPHLAESLDSYRLTEYAIKQALKDLTIYNADLILKNMVNAWSEIIQRYIKIVKKEEVPIEYDKVMSEFKKKTGIQSNSELSKYILQLSDYGKAILDEKMSSTSGAIDFVGIIAEFMFKFMEIKNDPRYFLSANPVYRKRGDPTLHIDITCLDPRGIVEDVFSKTYSTISCSGTINTEVFSKVLGLEQLPKGIEEIIIQSPFPERNILALIIKGISTRGNSRNDKTYSEIVKLLADVIMNTPKNVGIFCASYVVLRGILKNGIEELVKFSGKKFYRENSENSASDNTILIEKFKKDADGAGAVLLGVAGGRNSEGEDFPGDYMNAVCIVGIPFHRPTPRTEAKIKYYDRVFNGKGRLYAYIHPAFQRSNQAAGRPIRKLDDKGAILLFDERFQYYANMISPWIKENVQVINKDNGILAKKVNQFFKNN